VNVWPKRVGLDVVAEKLGLSPPGIDLRDDRVYNPSLEKKRKALKARDDEN
jgi:hypothetical protein